MRNPTSACDVGLRARGRPMRGILAAGAALTQPTLLTFEPAGVLGIDAPVGARPGEDLGDLGRRSRAPGLRWPAVVRPAMCGVATTSARAASRGEGIWSGARPTSRAAPAMRCSSRAAASAASSIRLPRERLTRKASGRISRSCAAPIRFSVSSVATASGSTKSERLQQLVELDLLDLAVLDRRRRGR